MTDAEHNPTLGLSESKILLHRPIALHDFLHLSEMRPRHSLNNLLRNGRADLFEHVHSIMHVVQVPVLGECPFPPAGLDPGPHSFTGKIGHLNAFYLHWIEWAAGNR